MDRSNDLNIYEKEVKEKISSEKIFRNIKQLFDLIVHKILR